MDTSRVIVTGGHGYIGRQLVRLLEAGGHQVMVADVTGTDPLDVRSDTFRDRAGEFRPDSLVHLAAVSWAPERDDLDQLIRQVNVEATRQVIRVGETVGVRRMVFASSASVFECCRQPGLGAVPDSRPEPGSAYGRSKVAGEQLLAGSQIPERVVVRAGTVCGLPDPDARTDLVVNRMVCDALTRGHVRVCGGTQWRPLVMLRRLVDCYASLALCGSRTDNFVDLGREHVAGIAHIVDCNVRVRWIAETVAETVGCGIVEEPGQSDRSYRVVDAPLWEPSWMVRTPLDRIVAEVAADAERIGVGRLPAGTESLERRKAMLTALHA